MLSLCFAMGEGREYVMFQGVWTALLSPFRENGALDEQRLARQAVAVLEDGAAGVALFGTTGECSSIGLRDRKLGLSALLEAGVAPDRTVLGLCATAVEDAATQALQGCDVGVNAFLAPPPFYFREFEDDGLFEWYSALIEAVPAQARFVLYHIPQVTGVGLSLDLIRRLHAAFPGRLLAVKDSSGDWANACALMEAKLLPVLLGDERLLHRAAPLGCAGSISGVANLLPGRLARIVEGGPEDAPLCSLVDRIVARPVIPALKALLAEKLGDPAWLRVRPPFRPLQADVVEALRREAAQIEAANKQAGGHG